MTNFKLMTEAMTEEAFQILCLLRPSGQRLKLHQIADDIRMEYARVEFILQQMVELRVAQIDGFRRYMLTPSYRHACSE